MNMRKPCGDCGCTEGVIETRNGQDCVFCANCGRYAGYNAPRSETGREVRSLRTRPDVKPGQRSRVLMRDNGTCVMCHRADVPLDVGHLVSVKDGRALGLTDAQIWHDENLAAMCQACNSGITAETIPLRLVATLLVARIQFTAHRGQAEEGATA